jgi:hypothetical protein
MDLIHHALLRDKEKPITNILSASVVIVGALPVVPTIATKHFVLFTNHLVKPNRVVPVGRIHRLRKR